MYVFIYVYVCMSLCVYVCTSLCICVYLCVCVCISVCVGHTHSGACKGQKRSSNLMVLDLQVVVNCCPTWVLDLNSGHLEEQ